jgi:hypothetical protein
LGGGFRIGKLYENLSLAMTAKVSDDLKEKLTEEIKKLPLHEFNLD